MNNDIDRLAREIGNEISLLIEPSGILYRIFNRAKTIDSIDRKMIDKKYDESDSKMQDIIGLRITLYFNDDIEILYNILKDHPRYLNETKDQNDDISFKPQRLNLIFKLKESHCEEIEDKFSLKYNGNIDTTFEIQIRTVLSEGWHEVEHDMRYKNKNDWKENEDVSRVLNGIYATLETQDWSILSLFDKLAHRHYKKKNWNAMLRSKFRIRFVDQLISENILEVLKNDEKLCKELFRTNRTKFLKQLINDKIKIPLTMDNVIHLVNIYFIRNKRLFSIAPVALIDKEELKQYIEQIK